MESTWVFSLQTACIHYDHQKKARKEIQLEIYMFRTITRAKNFGKVLTEL